MRPRRKLLIYAPDEVTLDSISFTLGLRHFQVFPTETPEELRSTLLSLRPDGVLVFATHSSEPVNSFCIWAKGQMPDVSIVAVATAKTRHGITHADRIVSLQHEYVAELRDVLKMILLRKRGPKRSTTSVVAA